VLTRAIFSEGCKAVAAGMNPMDLKRGIDLAVAAVVDELKANAKMISTTEQIAQVRVRRVTVWNAKASRSYFPEFLLSFFAPVPFPASSPTKVALPATVFTVDCCEFTPSVSNSHTGGHHLCQRRHLDR
jgi:hypothetical protein